MAENTGTWEAAVAWLRTQPDSHDLVQDAYFDDPLIKAAERYWQSNEWAAVRELIGKRRGHALDAGAGRGIASYALARDGFTVTALEPDPSALVGSAAIRQLAQDAGLPIYVEEELSERLPFVDASFDVIFCRAVLHHIDDLEAAMREFHRVLKPGGLFIAAREHVISKDADRAAFFAIHPLHHRYGGENAHLLATYTAAMRQSGLEIVQVIGSLDSPINFGPQSEAEVHRRIAQTLIPVAPLRAPFRAVLGLPLVGRSLRRVASMLDNRPGRHASFVAKKPDAT